MGKSIESLPETSLVHQQGREYMLYTYAGAELRLYASRLRSIATVLSREEYGIDNPQDVFKETGIKNTQGASIIVATFKQTGQVVAYSAQKVFRPQFEPSVRAMYSSGEVVIGEHKKKGLEIVFLTLANTLHGGPDILCGIAPDSDNEDIYLGSGIIIPETYSPRIRSYNESPRLKRVVEYIMQKIRGNIAISEEGVLSEIGKNGHDVVVIAGVKKGRTNFIDRVIQRIAPSDDTV